jgi:LysR family hca operon transcriptional activator
MNLRYLIYFITVAEELNFTRAAERLHTVQPSLSRQIHCLEEIVGTPLFHREKHKLQLTEAGRIFLEQARSILHQMDHAIILARQGARAEAGHVSIGYISGTESRIFAKLLPAIKLRYPEMRISYHAMTEMELIGALEKQEVDVAFLPGPIENMGLQSEVVLRQKVIAVLPASSPLARLKRIPLTRLAEVPWVAPSPAANPRYLQFVDQICRAGKVHFTVSAEHDNVLSALHAVSLGIGFSIIPDYQKAILPGSVVARTLDIEPQPFFELSVVYRKNDRLPALAFFLNIVRESMTA